ncbi:MAG TPA: glycosyltransferase family 4 protein [Candidatus Krumholzibacteria bacterium]|nr:glycosyltransferase family 4 protein [Candidatus Krumholzibacteria bacterium]
MSSADTQNRLRLLIIGPLPPHFGGAAQAMGTLIDGLATQPGVEVRLIDTVRTGGPAGQAKRVMGVISGCLRMMRHVDVVACHFSDPMVGGLAYYLTRLGRRPLLVARFGGVQPLRYWTGPTRRVEKLLLESAELNLLETQYQIDSIKDIRVPRLRQYPNNRPWGEGPDRPWRTGPCQRFIFLGHVNPDKGIRELIDAAERLPEGVSVDVYGELRDGIEAKDFANRKRIQHRGILPHGQIPAALREYDALVMPTHYEREGHPGAVIEAFQAGLPVVATRFMAIPEIVDDSNGLLVPPYDATALSDAMSLLAGDVELYRRLHEGALRRGRELSTEVWVPRYVEFCREIVQR